MTAHRTGGLGYQPDNIRQDYTGYQKDDESGLEYAEARYYNSSHGRFTSVDPLTASASIKNPQTFNRYSYALNSPYKFTDPLGLLPEGRRSSDGSCGAENSSCSDDYDPWEGREEVPEAQPTNEGVAGNQETAAASDSQQEAEEPEPPPPVNENETSTTTIDDLIPGNEDVGIEVIIWDGALLSWGGQFGHVSYVIDDSSLSWQMETDENGKEIWYETSKDEYIEERSSTSAGRGYVLDFGSPKLNRKFIVNLISAYDGQKEYALTTNNCAHAFQRAINSIAKDLNISRNDQIRPSKHEEFIKSTLAKYIVQRNDYPYQKGEGGSRK